jgi:hypothetical protein
MTPRLGLSSSPLVLLSLAWALCSGLARADSPAFPRRTEVKSADGSCVAVLMPEQQWKTKGPSHVTDATGKLFYTLDFFAWKIFFAASKDCRYLARPGPWAGDQKELSDLAVAFYDRGRLMKSYKVAELLKDRSRIQLTSSHYMWARLFRVEGTQLVVPMLDSWELSFDMTTGKLVKSTKLPESPTPGS